MKTLVCLIVAAVALQVSAAPYEELTPKFSRTSSRAVIRKIDKPTLANLDYAAYTANPVRFDPASQKPKAPAKKATLTDLTYGDLLLDVCDKITQTPLTDAEKQNPISFRPMVDRVWKIVKDPRLAERRDRIEGNKWGDFSIPVPFQEITAAYLHQTEAGTYLWLKIEFMPWVKFLEGVDDEDGDGFPEFYGRLSTAEMDPANVQKIIDWIRTDYTVKVLTMPEVKDWIMSLAGYWYPKLNTDVLDMAGETVWPDKAAKAADRSAIKPLKDFTVKNPAALVKGNPFGKIIYNVFLVENAATEAQAAAEVKPAEVAAPTNKMRDTTVSQSFKDNNAHLAKELAPYKTYDKWAAKLAPAITAQKNWIAKMAPEILGFKGKEDWVFFRKSLEEMTGGDLAAQPKEKNPIPHLVELKKYLEAQNVNLLFVPIPNKEEIYFEKLPFDMPKDPATVVNPYARKFLKDAQDAGIEVVDVLPKLLAAKSADKASRECLYQHQDTHWSNRGLQVVAQAIADRVKQYSWFPEAAKTAVTYTIVDTTFQRQGDIVERLPEADRSAYPPVDLQGQQVRMPDGKPYVSTNKAAPILLIGDSFTGVFESVDCKSAGVGSHIAQKTGLPTEVITSWGGGPLVRERMIRQRGKDMGYKRVVVYLMVSRDLYNYGQGWDPLPVEPAK